MCFSLPAQIAVVLHDLRKQLCFDLSYLFFYSACCLRMPNLLGFIT